MPKIVELDQFRHVLRGSVGLIVGPSLTLTPQWPSQLAEHLKTAFDVEAPGTYLELGTAAAAKGRTPQAIRDAIREAVRLQAPSPVLTSLSTVRWSALLSCSIDVNFETRLQEQADNRAGRRSFVMVSDLTTALPPRDVPAFKLLGSIQRDDFPVTNTQYLLQKNKWRRAIPAFADKVRGNPVLCLGMSGMENILLEILSEMLADRNSAPRSVILLNDDPLSANSQLDELLDARSEINVVRGSITDVVRVLTAAEKENYQATFAFSDQSSDPYSSLLKFNDICVVVNQHLKSKYTLNEKMLLLELLFSPETAKFDPFVHGLDFRRTIEKEVYNEISTLSGMHPDSVVAVVLVGTSATGKTTVLKRVALELATKGHMTIWLKPCFYPDPGRYCRKLFEEVARVAKSTKSPISIILDDAVGTGSIPPAVIYAAARDIDLPVALIFGIRSVDWRSIDKSLLLGDSLTYSNLELSDDLDVHEWNRLSDYLALLGVETSAEDARQRLRQIPQFVKDTLSVLFWLLPQTRQSITASVRSEFLSLGNPNIIRNIVAGSRQHSSNTLRTAYGMVAVADKYRVPLPIEVLVSALEIDYNVWLDAANEGGPVWGILYSIDTEEGGGEFYRTRNSIITDMLVETINGGIMDRSGEVVVLTQLIHACRDKTSPVYREFCIRLLVPGSRLQGLEYSQGIQLYNAAIGSLPFPDQTLVHHKGLWIKNVGSDPLLAIQVFEEALQTTPYPYTDKPEAVEHIHTSYAASVLDAIQRNLISREEGKVQVMEHLALARAVDFFNPHAVHVNAKHSAALIASMGVDKPIDVCSVATITLGDIDNALNVLQSPVDHAPRDAEAIHALEQVRDELLGVASDSLQVAQKSDELFEQYNSQLGFVLHARKLLAAAEQSGKGAHFNKAYDYVLISRRKIEDTGLEIDFSLLEIQIQIYYRWKVVRGMLSSAVGHVDWQLVRDISDEGLRHPRGSNNVLFKFLHALALAHLDDWAGSQLDFTEIRQSGLANNILWRPRALLVNSSGGPRTVQGVMRDAAGRQMVYSEELKANVMCDKRGSWPREGEITHPFIEFAFGGPRAIERINPN